MKKYNIKNRLFYDGYGLNQAELADVNYVGDFLERINKEVFNKKGKISLIPYFNGKRKKDGGISGIILGENFHFTCHTFCYKNTVFIDYYGNDDKKQKVLSEILKVFKTNDYDLGSRNIKGNFGKHIVFETNQIQFKDANEIIKKILKNIKMTAISELILNKTNNKVFDVLQPIAESHISFHQYGDKLIVDVFSCKDFDKNKVLSIFSKYEKIREIHRGLRFRKWIHNKGERNEVCKMYIK